MDVSSQLELKNAWTTIGIGVKVGAGAGAGASRNQNVPFKQTKVFGSGFGRHLREPPYSELAV